MTDPRSPCVIGVARRTFRPGAEGAPEPLDQWEQLCRAAAADSGGTGVLESADDLRVVYCLSWQYDDPAARLARRLGLRDGGRETSGMSGTSPQRFLQQAATAILQGRSELALVTGAEALHTRKTLKKQGRKPDWSHAPAQRRPPPFEDPFHPAEVAHEVFQAYLTFALFDVARRAHLGLAPEENRRQVAALFAPMTGVAARNPHAWFPVERTARELAEVTPENRMVAYPYAKNVVSMMDVDMGAAVVLASHEKADALGVPRERRVYLRGWCSAREPLYVAEREDLWRSPAMQQASREALARAGVGLDDVAHLDLYSCFGSSVNFAREALGLDPADPRPLTVTGGLPYHGGPGSNYVSHSVAEMVEVLRRDPGACGMVSGVGMHMTHHVFGVYSATPGPVRPPDEEAVQAGLDAAPRRKIRERARGSARVAAYSVVHGRGGPVWGLAICDLPEGDRCYARVEDPALLGEMQEKEWVGRRVELVDGGKVNLIAP